MPTKILLLDEPTASVEPDSEALIHQALLERSHTHQGTTLLVTHRLIYWSKLHASSFWTQVAWPVMARMYPYYVPCSAYREAYHHWQDEAMLS